MRPRRINSHLKAGRLAFLLRVAVKQPWRFQQRSEKYFFSNPDAYPQPVNLFYQFDKGEVLTS